MRCPECQSADTKVISTRLQDEAATIRRRRHCNQCGYRFSTLETQCAPELMVIKRDGSQETFEPLKILSALRKTFKKDARSDASIQELHTHIIKRIREHDKRMLSSQVIGDILLQELLKVDPMAYIRFASIYKDFQTPHDFASAADSIPTQ